MNIGQLKKILEQYPNDLEIFTEQGSIPRLVEGVEKNTIYKIKNKQNIDKCYYVEYGATTSVEGLVIF